MILSNNQLSNYFIICQPGLEQILKEELEELLKDPYFSHPAELNIVKGGIEIIIPNYYIAAFHYYLKSFTRILLRLESKKCRDFPKLYKIAQKLPWHQLIPPNYKIHISSKKSRVFDTSKIEDTFESAIKKYFQGHQYKQSQLDYFEKQKVQGNIYVRFENDLLTISLDLTGDRFDKRAQAKSNFSIASIRNSFAYALIKESCKKLNLKSKYHFLDPFCGSGTFLDEVNNLHQKNDRGFYFENIFPEIENFTLTPTSNIFSQIEGSDIDEKMIDNLKNNNYILNVKDVMKLSVLPKNCVIITNPPYGIRINDQSGRKNSPAEFIQAAIRHLLSLDHLDLLSIIIPSDYSFDVKNDKFIYERGLKFKNGGISVQQHIFYLKKSTSL